MSIKEQIRKEIGRQKEINKRLLDGQLRKGCLYAFNQVLSFLDSLQQEQPEVDLEKEIETYFKGWYMDETDQGYILHTPDDHAGLISVKQVARHFAEWGMNQCPLPEDTAIFQKGVAEGRRLEREEQKPELVQHPAISYMCNADASRGEQYKQALIALLKSDLIQVAGRRFTKTELIEWVETRPAEMKDEK